MAQSKMYRVADWLEPTHEWYRPDTLDVVKLVIEFRQEQNAAAQAKREKRARRAKLLEALENRENTELASMSKEAILKQLEELD